MEKAYIIKAYNGIDVVDDRIQAEDFLYALDRLDRLERRKQREAEKKPYNRFFSRFVSACRLL